MKADWLWKCDSGPDWEQQAPKVRRVNPKCKVRMWISSRFPPCVKKRSCAKKRSMVGTADLKNKGRIGPMFPSSMHLNDFWIFTANLPQWRNSGFQLFNQLEESSSSSAAASAVEVLAEAFLTSAGKVRNCSLKKITDPVPHRPAESSSTFDGFI